SKDQDTIHTDVVLLLVVVTVNALSPKINNSIRAASDHRGVRI
ncbi:unnamed protein product, partial [Heterotrigona itama]